MVDALWGAFPETLVQDVTRVHHGQAVRRPGSRPGVSEKARKGPAGKGDYRPALLEGAAGPADRPEADGIASLQLELKKISDAMENRTGTLKKEGR